MSIQLVGFVEFSVSVCFIKEQHEMLITSQWAVAYRIPTMEGFFLKVCFSMGIQYISLNATH